MLKYITTKKIIVAALLLLSAVAAFYYYYTFQYEVVYQGRIKEKTVAITFDDGPDPRFTPEALDMLKQYSARATFFVVGRSAENYPDIIRRIDREGHELGNHTYSHPDLLKLSRGQIISEIRTNQRIIKQITGKNVKWFRPPKKAYGPTAKDAVKDEGLSLVLWEIGVENVRAKTPQAMAERVLSQVQPGWIILIHDGRLNRTKSIQALPILLKKLKERGYSCVTLSELLAPGRR